MTSLMQPPQTYQSGDTYRDGLVSAACAARHLLLDTVSNKAARKQIFMIKVAVAKVYRDIADRCIQLFGARGVTSDTPAARAFGKAARSVFMTAQTVSTHHRTTRSKRTVFGTIRALSARVAFAQENLDPKGLSIRHALGLVQAVD